MPKEIIVEIDENGKITLETTGFKGKSCIEESQWIKDLVGTEISRALIPAYFIKEDKKIVKKHLNLCG